MNALERAARQGAGKQIEASDRTASFTSSSKAMRFYLQSFHARRRRVWLVLQQEISPGMMIAGFDPDGPRAWPRSSRRSANGACSSVPPRAGSPCRNCWRKTPGVEAAEDRTARAEGLSSRRKGVSVVAPARQVPALRNISVQGRARPGAGRDRPVGRGQDHAGQGADRHLAARGGQGAHGRCGSGSMAERPAGPLFIGYLPQEIGLLSGTVADNIARLSIPNPTPSRSCWRRNAPAPMNCCSACRRAMTPISARAAAAVGRAAPARRPGPRALWRSACADPGRAERESRCAGRTGAGRRDPRRQKPGRTVMIMAHRP